jgi:hypothetical protein
VATAFQMPFVPAIGLTGLIAPAATLTFYLTGTTTLAPIYDDDGGALPNPVLADAFGRFVPIYLDEAIVYRVILKTALGVELGEIDPFSQSGVFTQGGTGSVTETILTKLLQFPQTVRDKGAKGDGTTDDRAAFASADANGAFTVPSGLYSIGSDLTLTNRVTFESGARLVIPNGVTVTFNGGLDAPDTQIFNIIGTGAVAGLFEASFEWFADDAKASGSTTPTVECRSLMNAFAASLNVVGTDYITTGGSVARFGPGTWLLDGTTATTFHNCSIYGAGSGQTNFLWTGAACNGFVLIGNRAQVSGFQWSPAVPGTPPTAGTIFLNQMRNGAFTDVITNDCFIGWDVPAAASTNTYRQCHVYGAASIGNRVSAQEQHWVDSHVVAISDWCTLTSPTGTFNIGDAVSITGSAGVITDNFGSGNYKIAWTGNLPATPTAITNTTSGGSATLSSNTPAHQVAALKWYTSSSSTDVGNITHDGDIIGGAWGLRGQGINVNSVVSNPSWCRTAINFCVDTTYFGSTIDKCYGWDVHGWFSSSRNEDAVGLLLTNNDRIRINSVQFVNNSGCGLVEDGTNYYIQIINPEPDGNCHNASTTTALAEVALICAPGAAVHDVLLQGGTMGHPDLFGRTPNLGLYVGNSDGTSGAHAARVALIGVNVAAGKAVINATQVNGTDQRLRISCCTDLTDQ